MIPLKRDIKNSQTDRSREENDGCQGMRGGGNWGVIILWV